uniref:Auxin-responsive protein n=1 Tax=Aegilops tauschii subsp. strangulata TaxID=200361 RepID=A0A452Y5T5_AEGTS
AKGRNNGSKPRFGLVWFSLVRPAAAAPVVGWPPVRSFRRNLASSSSKPPAAEPHHGAGGKADCSIYKGRFVKINMDGVPIGRKVDLKAHGSYGKLADAVDHLFQGLLAARGDHGAAGRQRRVHSGVRGRRGRPDAGRGRAMGHVHRHREEAARAAELGSERVLATSGGEP